MTSFGLPSFPLRLRAPIAQAKPDDLVGDAARLHAYSSNGCRHYP
jgi:hypothetical protein